MSQKFTQSTFFSSVFNSAIFDGPVRIYFSQEQEALALNFYHQLREGNKNLFNQINKLTHSWNSTVYIMIYPDKVSLQESFGGQKGLSGDIAADTWETNHVIGIDAINGHASFAGVITLLEDIFEQLESSLSPYLDSSRTLQ